MTEEGITTSAKMKMLWLCVALALVGAQKEAAADVSEVGSEVQRYLTVVGGVEHSLFCLFT